LTLDIRYSPSFGGVFLDFFGVLWYNEIMVNTIIKLYKNHRELTLLEITYFVLMIIAFMVAGIVALFSQSLGVSILVVPLVCLIAGVMNLVAWSLVKLALDNLMAWHDKKNGEKPAPKTKNTKK